MSAYPPSPLGQVLIPRKEFVTIDDFAEYKRVRVRLHTQGVELRDVVQGSDVKTKSQQVCHANDVVFAEIDAKVGGYGLIPPELDGAIVSSHYFLYEIDRGKAQIPFVGYALRSPSFQDQVAARGSTNYAAIRPHHVLDYEIFLPDLDEQHRIVSRLDSLLARVSVASEATRRSRRRVGALRRALIDESMKKLPVGTRTLHSLLEEPLRNGWSPKATGLQEAIPVLTLAAVTGFRYDATAVKYTTEAVDESGRYWLQPGDLLITRSNTPDLVGHAAIYSGQPSPCIYPDLIMRGRLLSAVSDERFVLYWLQTSLVREHIVSRAKGSSVSMVKISQRDVEEIPFPDLELDNQQEIASHLDRLTELMDSAENRISRRETFLRSLGPSILNQVFAG